jgi:hypothetical protein
VRINSPLPYQLGDVGMVRRMPEIKSARRTVKRDSNPRPPPARAALYR